MYTERKCQNVTCDIRNKMQAKGSRTDTIMLIE